MTCAIRHERRYILRHVDTQRQPLLRDQRLVERRDLRDDRTNVEFARRDGELVRGATRIGEDLADCSLPAARDDARDALALALRQGTEDAVAQDLGVGDDGRERRAQVMRDVRQELRLERVTRLRSALTCVASFSASSSRAIRSAVVVKSTGCMAELYRTGSVRGQPLRRNRFLVDRVLELLPPEQGPVTAGGRDEIRVATLFDDASVVQDDDPMRVHGTHPM